MPHNCATRSSLVIFEYNESTFASMSAHCCGICELQPAIVPASVIIAAYLVMGFINALINCLCNLFVFNCKYRDLFLCSKLFLQFRLNLRPVIFHALETCMEHSRLIYSLCNHNYYIMGKLSALIFIINADRFIILIANNLVGVITPKRCRFIVIKSGFRHHNFAII